MAPIELKQDTPACDHVEKGESLGPVASNIGHTGTGKKVSPAEIKLVRRLDWTILPVLWVMYWFNYLDRNAITVARLDGMEKELNMTSTEYQTCVSILFVGYILGQIPSNMLITRVRPSWFMGGAMALWAIVSTLTAVTKDYKGLLLTRFFLGITEAPFYPGALYILSMFYDRQEIATRISILFSANICGTAFAGLIAIGVFQMEQLAGLSGWRWLFIIQGVITFVISIASIFILPNEPLNTRWLSEDDQRLAHSRVARDTVELEDNTSTWAGLVQAIRDPHLWVLVCCQHCHMAASNFKNFFPTMVETLGFDRNVTLALTCPPYLISGVISVIWAASSGELLAYSFFCVYMVNNGLPTSGRFNERVWHITIAKAIAVFGFVLACSTLNTGARYFAMCAFATGVYACNSVILGWVSSTCGQTREKKAVSLALVNTIATIGPIYSPVSTHTHCLKVASLRLGSQF
ncbi:major facilitator superfamily transporter [Colletotrichum gloeosporioides Cg-14]|uniref:Major facilitator superfamily transporter n=1 Tax=Colletotrichum gloeosporioides (strain Cg-14) TaxID=1237896 RepID=T0JWB3_COLGC|nr:major facilitator superfamily transporter [Colletotrichum gloeosporioides Cg-14]